MKRVVTYQDTRGGKISICPACEAQRKDDWPKNAMGEEYATVSHGLHTGTCDVCERTHDTT